MSKIKVGISIGDLNGIGLETIIKTFKDKRMLDFCTPIVFGSSKVVAKHKKGIEINDFNFNIINKIEDAKPHKANLLNIWNDDVEVKFGEATTISGEKSFESIKKAAEALKFSVCIVLWYLDLCFTSPIIVLLGFPQKLQEYVVSTFVSTLDLESRLFQMSCVFLL